jgi:hypothetical protein
MKNNIFYNIEYIHKVNVDIFYNHFILLNINYSYIFIICY